MPDRRRQGSVSFVDNEKKDVTGITIHDLTLFRGQQLSFVLSHFPWQQVKKSFRCQVLFTPFAIMALGKWKNVNFSRELGTSSCLEWLRTFVCTWRLQCNYRLFRNSFWKTKATSSELKWIFRAISRALRSYTFQTLLDFICYQQFFVGFIHTKNLWQKVNSVALIHLM